MVRVENAASKIYVGNLGDYGDKAELERAFSKYGEVVSVWERVTITFFLLKMRQMFFFKYSDPTRRLPGAQLDLPLLK